MPESSVNSKFRLDIEGLRGIAIFLVLLFHAQIPGFAGGFFGVDIFYVISGYLITGLLIRERESTGKISLKLFYSRRARRLLPMATVVLVATLVASYYFAPRLLMPGIAFDVASAVVFLSNMNFAHHATDYFANSMPSPVLHFWSLSVEEQYYMLWPALAIFFTRKAKSVSVRMFFSLLALGSLSFWFATWLITKNQSWAFFSLPSRAWELALGGLLASAKLWVDKIPKTGLLFAQWLATIALIYSLITLRSTDPFPGPYALLPTIATALFLLGGSSYSPNITGSYLIHLPSRFLASRPIRFLGKISYSLYLWHWPVLIIVAYHYKDGLNLIQRSGIVVISILLATLSYYLIENPFRHGKLIGKNPGRNLVTALVVLLLVSSSSLAVSATLNSEAKKSVTTVVPKKTKALERHPSRSPKGSLFARPATIDFPVPKNLTPSLIGAENDRPLTYIDRCHTQQNLLPSNMSCLYGDPNGTRTIVLFGDSHALAWFPALNDLAIDNHWKLLSLTMSACSPADMPGYDRVTAKVMQNCTTWRKWAISKIIDTKPYIVLVTGTRGFVTVDAKNKTFAGLAGTSLWETGMKKTLTQLKIASPNVIMMMDVPLSIYDPKVCLSENLKSTLACATPVDKAISLTWQSTESTTAQANNVKIINPSFWVCPTDPCPVVIGNVLVYLDAGHMTATFSASLSKLLGESIKVIIKETASETAKAKALAKSVASKKTK